MASRELAVSVIVLLSALSIVALGVPSGVAQDENKAQVEGNAPPFSVETLENVTVSLEGYRGKVLILEFFSSGCHVCKDATPKLRRIRENFSPENVALLSIESRPGVSIRNVRNFKSEYGGNWSFAKAPSVAERYGVEGWPTMFVIGLKGVIRSKHLGTTSPAELGERVSEILKTQKVDLTPLIIDLEVDPEKGGGIVAAKMGVGENRNAFFTFKARANPGYRFDGWRGQAVPENQRSSPTLRLELEPGMEVTASFSPVENQREKPENRCPLSQVSGFDVGVNPNGAGFVVVEGVTVADGRVRFTYRAEPSPGYRFESWSGKRVPEGQRHSPKIQVNLQQEGELTAAFKQVEQVERSLFDRIVSVFESGSFLLGAVIAGCIGVLLGYLVGCKKTA